MEQNKSEIEMVASLPGLNKDIKEDIIMKKLKMQEDQMKQGLLDKFFGRINTKIYFALLLVTALIVLGVIINVINDTSKYWEYIFPLIGAVAGYILGKNDNE